MVIEAVDTGLENLLRAWLPLPPETGDVSFDPPDRTWGAARSRLTVNAFLFDVLRSPQPPQRPGERTLDDGRVERRAAMPLVALHYLVSAWAGNVRDEHHLLAEALGCVLAHPVLPAEHLPAVLESPVQLALGTHEGRKPQDIWQALDTRIKPAFEVVATVALEILPWEPAAPIVRRVDGLVAPRPGGATAATPAPTGGLTRRRAGATVTSEGRPGS